MKKALFTLTLVAASFSSFAAVAQQPTATPAAAGNPDAYTAMMAATIQDLMSTGDPAKLKQADAKLERAAQVAPKDWLPRYYQAYARTITAFVSKEEDETKDKYLDQAEAALAQARKLGGEESELLVVQAYIYQARLSISPMLRSMKYSKMVTETLAQAKKLNPANPRIYLVQANNVYYTPSMFGGGADVAKPLFQEAQTRFTAFKPTSVLAPNWGERQVKGRLKSYETASVK
ncbi:hypothetical protein HNQ93_003683 [Hymenobacter luteus]|uniref:Uncharacterized protein n=2 Tax=Hymenobacter TaxID=89966 RepID=A0A7W9T4B0_9BACT|nr:MULTISPECIES: hypothetical protein [Hymenobacter]MBB4602916.1 hypothetical protein [Hymenobacter latericoloratus]MBB6060808.1 hypothetical protein [Hymenobacter luteus]